MRLCQPQRSVVADVSPTSLYSVKERGSHGAFKLSTINHLTSIVSRFWHAVVPRLRGEGGYDACEQARSRILGTLTGKWQRDAPFFTHSGLHTDSIFGQVRNTTVQVWTIGEGFGIGSEFSQTCCAVNNFRDHDLTSPLQFASLTRPDPRSVDRVRYFPDLT
jgi:hypothetical protein